MQIIEHDTRLDPIKYNKGQLIQLEGQKHHLKDYKSNTYTVNTAFIQKNGKKTVKNVISVDWFEATISVNSAIIDPLQETIQLADNIFLLNDKQRTSHFLCKWSLIYNGEKVATLLTCPSASFIAPNQSQIKIENSLLYTVDWLDIYKDILIETNWTHKNITRLDIAIDGASINNALKLISDYDKGQIIGRKGKALFHSVKDPGKELKRFHVGTSASEKVATIYNKSKEIQNSDKDYIKQFWLNNGLENIDNTHRFELRLKSKITKNYDLNKLDQNNYLASIVKTEIVNWFEFYYKGKDKNKHRTYKNGTMEWIDWNEITGQLLPKNKAFAKQGIHRAKRLIKDLNYIHHVEGKRLDKSLVSLLISEYCLQQWYDSKIEYWIQDFEKEKKYKDFGSN